MTEDQKIHAFRQAFQKFFETVERLRTEHRESIKSILRQIDERKVRDVRRRLGIGE